MIDNNFAFYVSGNAGRLKLYIETFGCNNIGVIISDNPKDVELDSLAKENKLELYFYNGENSISDFILEKIIGKYEYLFCFGKKILKGKLLSCYENKIINFHPSILPACKGIMAIDQALNTNSILLGNTAHFINSGIDTGPIIMQNISLRKEFVSYSDVLDKQIIMLSQIMKWIIKKRIFINNNIVNIKDAEYSIGEFIPSLEI